MKFAGRLVVGTVMVLLITVIALVTMSEVSLRRDLEDDFAIALGREARLVREALPSDSTLWQAEIHREEARKHLEALYRKRFGAEYDEVVRVRAWLKDHPQRASILAFLVDPEPFEP